MQQLRRLWPEYEKPMSAMQLANRIKAGRIAAGPPRAPSAQRDNSAGSALPLPKARPGGRWRPGERRRAAIGARGGACGRAGACERPKLGEPQLRGSAGGGSVGRWRRSAMNWSNSERSLAKRSRSRNSLNSRCSSSSRFSVSAR